MPTSQMKKLYLDFETRSAVDIRKVGAYKYAMDPSTEIICLAISDVPGGKPLIWKTQDFKAGRQITGLGASIPNRLVAHSAHFEYAIYNYILHKRYGWPALWEPASWDCTLSRAVVCGLPASLEKVALALGLPIKKDMEGRAALMKICKPSGFDPLGAPIYNEDPALYEKVYKYCGVDVETEMAADAILPELSPDERKVWELDLIMNHRGVQTDVKTAAAASRLALTLTSDLNAQLRVLTGGAVDKASRIQAIKEYLTAQGLTIGSLDKASVMALMADPAIPQHIKDVIKIRSQVGKSSTAKYAATIDAAGDDGRVRGALQYHAAATGRWGGRLIQPQNYPKGLGEAAQARAIAAINAEERAPGMFQLMYGDQAMETLSGALRGTITAAPGKKLVVADFSTIEFCVLMWVADEIFALEELRQGRKPYIPMAQYIFKRDDLSKDKTPFEYAVGKFTVLGAGFQMGPPRFRAQCAQAGVDISEETSVAAIKAYREKYKRVVQMWYATERAAVLAIKNPDTVQHAMGGKVLFGMSKDRRFLACRLPSGRFLRYYRPSVKLAITPGGSDKEQMNYWSVGSTGAFEEQKTYGGSLVENIVQAVARDLMANGMLKVEAAGYNMVMTVHDELVAEVLDIPDIYEPKVLETFIKLMCDVPPWAAGCPVTAEGWIGERYRK